MKIEELDAKLSIMNRRLNEIIRENGYNLQSSEVIDYSRQIDRIIEIYVKCESNAAYSK